MIGNLGENTDWTLLEQAIERIGASWVFVGSPAMPIADPAESAARARVVTRGGRVRFLGPRPYSTLVDYARGFDAAVLPYRRREPTYSGSSTRYYEHLAAGRPMLATGVPAELLDKAPLVTLLDTAEEMVAAFEALRASGFRDGVEDARWRASREGTWEARARQVREALRRSGQRSRR